MTRSIEGKHKMENAERWKKAYLEILSVFIEYFKVFGLRHSYFASFCGFFGF